MRDYEILAFVETKNEERQKIWIAWLIDGVQDLRRICAYEIGDKPLVPGCESGEAPAERLWRLQTANLKLASFAGFHEGLSSCLCFETSYIAHEAPMNRSWPSELHIFTGATETGQIFFHSKFQCQHHFSLLQFSKEFVYLRNCEGDAMRTWWDCKREDSSCGRFHSTKWAQKARLWETWSIYLELSQSFCRPKKFLVKFCAKLCFWAFWVSSTLPVMDSKPTLSRPPVSILMVSIPKTVPLSYEKTFTKVDDVTATQLKRISESRQEVVVASERSFADAAIRVWNIGECGLFPWRDDPKSRKTSQNTFFCFLPVLALWLTFRGSYWVARVLVNIFLNYLDWYEAVGVRNWPLEFMRKLTHF